MKHDVMYEEQSSTGKMDYHAHRCSSFQQRKPLHNSSCLMCCPSTYEGL